MFRARGFAAAFKLTFLGLALNSGLALSQETKPADPAAKPEEKPADLYAIPEGADAKALQKFIRDVLDFTPNTVAEARTHEQKRLPALKAAAEQWCKLETDKTSSSFRQAKSLLIQIGAVELDGQDAAARKAFMAEVLAFIDAAGPNAGPHEAGAGAALCQSLEDSDDPLAGKAYAEVAARLSKSDDARIVKFSQQLAGSGRRLSLPGNSMRIVGKRMDGAEFDLKSLAGKVVLVDFWATWCGPCIGEIPNMKKSYEKYHEKGFEIVGLSLDQNRDSLEEFLKDRELPWVILHDEQGEASNANYYGISSIPAMFLINREGKVISTQARGEELNRLLEAEFGGAKADESGK